MPLTKLSSVESTAREMLRSAGAASLSQVWRLGVTFLTHMALRRLIPPSEMGVWNWVEGLFLVLAQVRDLGLPGHIVRDPRRPYGTFLGLQLAWGGVLSISLFIAAPLLTLWLYKDDPGQAADAVRILCLFLFVQGLGAVPMVYFEAELKVHETVPAEIARNLVFALVSLSLAIAGYGVWSVIVAHIVGAALYAVLLWIRAWGRIPLPRVERIGPLIQVGIPLALMSFLEQAVLRLDTFIVAKRFPTEAVSFAGLAMFAAFFFSRLLADPVGRALYPALVRYRDQPGRAFDAFRVATLFQLALAVPTGLFLFLNAPFTVRVLGGSQWLGAAAYLQILALVPFARPLNMFGLEMLLTRHRDRLLIFYSLFNLLAMGGLGLYLTTTRLGPLGMAVAGFFPLGSLLLAWGLYQLSPRGFRRLLVEILEIYAVGAISFAPVLLVGSESTAWRLVFSCAAGLLMLVWVARRFGERFRHFLSGMPSLDDDTPSLEESGQERS